MKKGIELSPCQICGGTTFIDLYQVKDNNQDVEGTWNIVKCKVCGLGRLEPLPDVKEIDSFYRDVFYTDGGQRFRPVMEYLRGLLAGNRGEKLNALFPERGKLMDFGSGASHFGKAMAEKGWEVTNFDPYSSAAGSGFTFLNTNDQFVLGIPDNTYDVVTLWYVIEHLRNPREAIKEFRRILKPGGVLLLSQQNFASLQARVFGPCWLILDPPRHLFHFSPKNLGLMAEEEHFDLAMIDHSCLEMGPYTILQSLLNVLLGNKNYLFKYLKNKKLKSVQKEVITLSWLSILLIPVLGSISFIVYWALLLFGSGDLFTVYLRKKSL